MKGQGKVLNSEKLERLVLRLAPTWIVGACSCLPMRVTSQEGARWWCVTKIILINVVQVIDIYTILRVRSLHSAACLASNDRRCIFYSRNFFQSINPPTAELKVY